MNVTYLLGAGASSNCLPTYSNFVDRFTDFGELFGTNNAHYGILSEENQRFADSIRRIIDTVKEEFKYHNTPDTIAKKYFHKFNSDQTELNNLKEILILFFLYSQIYYDSDSKKSPESSSKSIIDKRYDAFIASLLKPAPGEREMLNEFKILTWNYDVQFEKAYSNYEVFSFSHIQESIQSIPRIDGNNDFSNLDIGKFSIVHLNGLAYAKPLNNISTHDLIGSFIDDKSFILDYLLKTFKSLHYYPQENYIGGNSLLTFAWENQNPNFTINDNSILKFAKQIAKQTEILVIIGYSFPMFNNPIDQAIFEEMRNLKKIYIQSPQAQEITKIIESEFVRNSAITKNDIIDLGYWHQFHIPYEWKIQLPEQYSIA